MSTQELVAALEPTAVRELPFYANDRQRPGQREAPTVVHLDVLYRQWDGPRLSRTEDFGKGRGQVYSRDGGEPLRSCNEVEVAKRLRRIRQNAYWISSYSTATLPEIWRPWTLGLQQVPAWLFYLNREIGRLTGKSNGGVPDVVAWNDERSSSSALFVECKAPKEGFKDSQERWIAAALACGVAPTQIAVAVRQFVERSLLDATRPQVLGER